MKIYLLWIAGEIEGLFSSEELAVKYINNSNYSDYLKSTYYVDEVEVDNLLKNNEASK